jgi:hypothetical protein
MINTIAEKTKLILAHPVKIFNLCSIISARKKEKRGESMISKESHISSGNDISMEL